MTSRRTLLSHVVASGSLAALAGCVGGDGGQPTTEPEPTASPTPTPTAEPEPTASPTPTPTAEPEPTPRVVDVAAGPEGRLRFVPETVEIRVGDTVRWTFESPGHNVTTKPGSSEKVSIPDAAEPFASYEGDQHFAIEEEGSTYEYTFSVPGEYVYVCAPHAGQGMVGTVIVLD